MIMTKLDSRFYFWQKWLTFANVLTIVIGLLVAFAGNSFLFDNHNDYSAKVFFKGNAWPIDILKFKNWLFGIIGGTIVGFHILMVLISENAFKNGELWAYKAMWLAMLLWFFIDSGLSLYFGALHNVLLINLPAMFMIGLPLLMTKKYF